MNFLTWVFGLGALAVVLPLLFHLIRRTPRRKQQFSSLMFIKPSPPRLTRRSRLDNWLLFLLRSAAVVLLAIAFMRPFIPQSTTWSAPPGRQVAVLIDTSASMKQADFQQQAIAAARQYIDNLEPQDQVALFTFDSNLQSIVGFGAAPDSVDSQRQLVKKELDLLESSWSETDLGSALIGLADQLESIDDEEKSLRQSQIVLISDLQGGASLDALNQFEWPQQVMVDVVGLQARQSDNASLQVIANESTAGAGQLVRVTNSDTSQQQMFSVAWQGEFGELGVPTQFVVPPGASRALEVTRPLFESDRLVLSGDDMDFDNTRFDISQPKRELVVGYLGDDEADDVEGLQFYLARSLINTETRSTKIVDDWDALRTGISNPTASPDLLVVSRQLAVDERSAVENYLALGKTVLFVITSNEMAMSLGPLFPIDNSRQVQGDRSGDYRMLGQIDFNDPLFHPLRGAKFNDFTKIRFWNHFAVQFETGDEGSENEVEILAGFDNGDPALAFRQLEKGRVFLLASGWDPGSSGLSLSTKFVPLMNELLEQSLLSPPIAAHYLINQTISLPAPTTQAARSIIKPDTTEIKLGNDQLEFNQTDEPGVYTLMQDNQQLTFAVNLSPSESRTSPIDSEQLAIHNIPLGQQELTTEVLERLKREGNARVEARQKIWKWALLLVLGLVALETLLAARKQTRQTGNQPMTEGVS